LYGDDVIKRTKKEQSKYNFENSSNQSSKPEEPTSVSSKTSKDKAGESKVVITGDDVLIEYVTRLIKILKEVSEV